MGKEEATHAPRQVTEVLEVELLDVELVEVELLEVELLDVELLEVELLELLLVEVDSAGVDLPEVSSEAQSQHEMPNNAINSGANRQFRFQTALQIWNTKPPPTPSPPRNRSASTATAAAGAATRGACGATAARTRRAGACAGLSTQVLVGWEPILLTQTRCLC